MFWLEIGSERNVFSLNVQNNTSLFSGELMIGFKRRFSDLFERIQKLLWVEWDHISRRKKYWSPIVKRWGCVPSISTIYASIPFPYSLLLSICLSFFLFSLFLFLWHAPSITDIMIQVFIASPKAYLIPFYPFHIRFLFSLSLSHSHFCKYFFSLNAQVDKKQHLTQSRSYI
jgi:hypothetical protein